MGRVHVAFDAVKPPDAIPGDVPPDHDVPAAVFDLDVNTAITELLTDLPPTPTPPIRPEEIEFGLVRVPNSPPLSRVLVPVL